MTVYLASQGIHTREKSSSVPFSYVVFYSSGGILGSFFTSTWLSTLMVGGKEKLKQGALKQQLFKHYSLQVRAIQVSHKTS